MIRTLLGTSYHLQYLANNMNRFNRNKLYNNVNDLLNNYTGSDWQYITAFKEDNFSGYKNTVGCMKNRFIKYDLPILTEKGIYTNKDKLMFDFFRNIGTYNINKNYNTWMLHKSKYLELKLISIPFEKYTEFHTHDSNVCMYKLLSHNYTKEIRKNNNNDILLNNYLQNNVIYSIDSNISHNIISLSGDTVLLNCYIYK